MDSFKPKTLPLTADDLAREAAQSPLHYVDEDDYPDEATDDSNERGDQAAVVDTALTNKPPG